MYQRLSYFYYFNKTAYWYKGRVIILQAKIVEKLLGFEVVQVACGASHVLAVTNEHEVFAWGSGDSGKCQVYTLTYIVQSCM